MSQRRLNSWRSAIRHLLLGGLAGLVIGVSYCAIVKPVDFVPTLVLPINVSVLFGFLIWLVGAANESSRLASARRSHSIGVSPSTDAENTPAPFVKRLAKYIGCEESELRQDRQKPRSKMSFWSIIDFFSWHGPKPVSLIRRILERIREASHGSSHGR